MNHNLSLAQLNECLDNLSGKIYLYGVNDIIPLVEQFLVSRGLQCNGVFDTYKTGEAEGHIIKPLSACKTMLEAGDFIFICASAFDEITKELHEQTISTDCTIINAYALFTTIPVPDISSYANLPKDIDLYISGTDTKAAITYDALKTLGYDRIKGFVSCSESDSFLDLEVIEATDYLHQLAASSAIYVADSRVLEYWACMGAPNMYRGDWLGAFQTVPELILERAFIEEYSQGASIALDVGCNLGIMSLMMLQLAEKVIGFEPNMNLHKRLESNTSRFSNFHYESLALSDKEGRATFFIDNITTGGSSFLYQSGVHQESFEVTIITLDKYCANNNIIPDFLKIDAEGVDGKVILGGKEMIRERRPPMMFEMWRHSWHLVEEAIYFLEEFYLFKDLSTGLIFDPASFGKHAHTFRELGDKAGHTNIGCIPRQ